MTDNLKATWVLFALCALIHVSGCKTSLYDTGPCTPQDLAKIEAAFVTEATAACRTEGAKTPETCKALPGIREKYSHAREAWVRCGQ